MQCLRCGCQNKATNEYCEGCGATLGRECSACGHLNGSTEIENTPLIHDHVVRVEVQSHQLVIELANPKGANPKRKRSRNVIEVPWHKTPSTRRREVLVPEAGPRAQLAPSQRALKTRKEAMRGISRWPELKPSPAI